MRKSIKKLLYTAAAGAFVLAAAVAVKVPTITNAADVTYVADGTYPVLPSASYTVENDVTEVEINVAYTTNVAFNDWCGNALKVIDADGTVTYYGLGGAQVTWAQSIEAENDGVVPGAGSDNYFALDSDGSGTFTVPVAGAGSVINVYDLCWDSVKDATHFTITFSGDEGTTAATTEAATTEEATTEEATTEEATEEATTEEEVVEALVTEATLAPAGDYSTYPLSPSYTYTVQTEDVKTLKVAYTFVGNDSVSFNAWCGGAIKVTDPDGTVTYYGVGGESVTWRSSLEADKDEIVPSNNDGDEGTFFVLASDGSGIVKLPVVEGSVVDFYDLCWTDDQDVVHFNLVLTELTAAQAEADTDETTEPDADDDTTDADDADDDDTTDADDVDDDDTTDADDDASSSDADDTTTAADNTVSGGATDKTDGTTNATKTGDAAPIAMVFGLMAFAAAGVVVLKKKEN